MRGVLYKMTRHNSRFSANIEERETYFPGAWTRIGLAFGVAGLALLASGCTIRISSPVNEFGKALFQKSLTTLEYQSCSNATNNNSTSAPLKQNYFATY
jgi:hypothetical protein